jgi:hypothetical protein
VAVALVVLSRSLLDSPTSNGSSLALSPATAAGPKFPFALTPDPVDFGVLHPGESTQSSLLIQNTQDETLALERIETSCPCIAAEPVASLIKPHETRKLTASFDRSSERNFAGPLGVLITGYLTGNKVAFQTRVKLCVGAESGQDEQQEDELSAAP